MLPKTHFILALIFSGALFFLDLANWWQTLVILASAVLIDVDHWFVYVIKHKDLSVKRAYKWFYSFYERGIIRRFFCIFHTIESYILVALLAWRFEFFLYVFIGMVFHLILDVIKAIDDQMYTREISTIYYLLKKLKKIK